MKIKYVNSDAWLLLAIVYAHKEGQANVESIIQNGDFINHAIFTEEELKGWFFRLTKGGYIKENKGEYSPTNITTEAYLKTTTPRRNVFKELEDMEKFLNITV
jgi:hypothetical protein